MSQAIYEGETYADNNPGWHEEDSEWKANHIANIIRKNGLAPRSICEIGCGAGKILTELEKRFPEAQLSGYEISPYALARAKTRESERTRFHLEDLRDQPDIHFDVLMMIDVFEHVEDYMGFLRSFRDRADYKIFHIPLDLSAQSITRSSKIMMQRESVGHIQYFYKETALATLRDCGYTVVDHYYTASRLELPNQTYTSQLMAWPRRAMFALAPDLAVRVLGGYSLLVLAK